MMDADVVKTENADEKKSLGCCGVVDMRFEYLFEVEKDKAVREWEKLSYQRQFEEKIYAVAQRMAAAVFANGQEHYCLASSGEMLESVFLQCREYQRLIAFGRNMSIRGVWIGMGVGDTMLEAQEGAKKALHRAIAEPIGCAYLVGKSCGMLRAEDYFCEGQTDSIENFAHRMGTSAGIIQKMQRVIDEKGDVLTASELAKSLGITTRSTNRILVHMEEAGCVTSTGKWTTGKGRPSRLLKITLPDGL